MTLCSRCPLSGTSPLVGRRVFLMKGRPMSDAKTPNPTIVSGRFQPGNKMACGRTSRGQKLRAAILASISRADVEAITKSLIEQAKAGDQGAAKILLGFIGKATEEPVIAIQHNVSTGASIDRDQHPPEPATTETLEVMRADIMVRIARARDAC